MSVKNGKNYLLKFFYKFYVLNTGLDENAILKLKKYENGKNFSLEYVDVVESLSKVKEKSIVSSFAAKAAVPNKLADKLAFNVCMDVNDFEPKTLDELIKKEDK